jgi:hypothetical protein
MGPGEHYDQTLAIQSGEHFDQTLAIGPEERYDQTLAIGPGERYVDNLEHDLTPDAKTPDAGKSDAGKPDAGTQGQKLLILLPLRTDLLCTLHYETPCRWKI